MAKFKNNRKKVLLLWTPAILWAMIIFLFSSMPTTPVSQVQISDFIIKKSAHIIEYAVLTTLLYRALFAGGFNKRKAGIYSVVIAVVYAVTDEFHQSFTPGRDPKVRDVFFDTIGSVSAIYIIWNLLPKAPHKLRVLAKRLQIL
jgi:VanZ family protein